jgi:prevent-host-death family protein
MPNIRPISDLRNHFADITREVQLTNEPVFLTKNGVGSIVVMSMEAYEQRRYDDMVYNKLKEAEIMSMTTTERYSLDEVIDRVTNRIRKAEEGSNAQDSHTADGGK